MGVELISNTRKRIANLTTNAWGTYVMHAKLCLGFAICPNPYFYCISYFNGYSFWFSIRNRIICQVIRLFYLTYCSKIVLRVFIIVARPCSSIQRIFVCAKHWHSYFFFCIFDFDGCKLFPFELQKQEKLSRGCNPFLIWMYILAELKRQNSPLLFFILWFLLSIFC